MNYNEYIKPRITSYIISLVNSLDENLNFTEDEIDVVEDAEDDMNYFVNSATTCSIAFRSKRAGVPFDITVPRMINELFIIEGKVRSPIINMGYDNECRINDQFIIIDYNKLYSIADKTLSVKDETTGQERKDLLENFSEEELTLTPYQIKKFSIKLNWQCGDKIDSALIEKCIEYGSDLTKDFILDKRFTSVGSSLIKHLNYSRGSAYMSMISKYSRWGNVYVTDIQNAVNRFFNLQSNLTLSIQIPNSINPLSIDTIKNKVVIPPHVSYNKSFVDIIDVIDTPENNNVNRLNELNKCITLKNDEVYITLENLKGEEVTIPYIDYLDAKVLPYNYKEMNTLEAKYRGGMISLNSIEEAQYVDPHPDDKLSVATRRIPLVNFSDSVRISMAASMLKQSIELVKMESPLVSSGNDDEDLKNNSYTVFSEVDGEVISIQKSIITIETGSGEYKYYRIPDPIKGINNISITFSTSLKVGDTVKKGDTVVVPNSLKKNSFDFGLNTRVAFMPYRGYNNEDAIVVSKSYAKRMAHYSIHDLYLLFKGNETLDGIVPIGTKLKSRDEIVSSSRSLDLREVSKGLEEAFNLSKIVSNRNNALRVPNNLDNAFLTDVKVIKGNLPMADYLEKSVSELQIDRTRIVSELPGRLYNKELDDIIAEEPEEYALAIKVRVVAINEVKVGDKLCNRYGSKGVVSLVQEDELMPRGEDGKIVDMVLNPYSIIGRKNPSQLIEMKLASISKHLYEDTVTKAKDNSFDFKEFKSRVKKYYGDKFEAYDLPTFESELLRKGEALFTFNTGCFSNLNPEEVLAWVDELNIESEIKLFDPVSNRWIKKNIMVGPMYMLKLYHLPEYTGKVTPANMTGDAPMIGRGNYREAGGQKVGEMELHALLSYNQESLISKFRGDSKENSYIFLNSMIAVGLGIKNAEGFLVGSSHESDVKKLISKFRR